MSKKVLRPAFKIHGGKRYLAKWIIEHFPQGYQDMVYLEPYCGAASVLLNKEPSLEEYINDTNKGIVNIFKAIRDTPKEFIKRLKKFSYSKESFESALQKDGLAEGMDLALNEFILRRMSRGGLKEAFAWSNRERGGKPGDVNAWETIIELLPQIADRIEYAFIFNRKALEVINAFNNENTLVYADPPYLPDTRVSKKTYKEDEMSIDDHIELLNNLIKFKGKVIISGYESTLYKKTLAEWNMKSKKVASNASQQKTKPTKTECIWINY